MENFKLSPGRIAWIAILALLGFITPRIAVKPPAGPPAVQYPELQSSTNTQAPTQFIRRGSGSLKAGEDLFSSGSSLPRLSIEVSRSEMAKLRSYNWQWGGNAGERQNAKATIYEGGVAYTNVAIHLKGSAGSFRKVDDKPALTVNFDKLAPGQRFHGLKKIHLNNSVQDPSYLSEQISRELFLAAGVPTTRATQAKVELNGRDLGVYVLIEGWNKQFLKRHFKEADGVLYDGGFAKEITYPLEIMSGDRASDRSDLAELADVARNFAPGTRDPDKVRRSELTRLAFARLDKILDLDRFITFIAMESLLAHADGYAMNHNNYRIYHDPGSGKLVFMPHGMDQMFGSWSSRPTHSITPQMKGLVARVVMQTPDGYARYMERLGELYTNVYKTDLIVKRVDELSARLRPLITEGSLWAGPGHSHAVSELRRRIIERGMSIQDQLAKPRSPLDFSQAREVRPSEWRPTNRGNAKYAEARSAQGHRLLKIGLQGSGSGSWRSTVLLQPGEYHFVGRVKIEGLAVDPADSRSGVGLRLSGSPLEQRLVNDSDWTELSYDFGIQGTMDIQLVCELKGLHGEVTFDADSLRLHRK